MSDYERVIFSIDHGYSTESIRWFLNDMDQVGVNVSVCIGGYNNQLEISYMGWYKDLHHFKPWISEQKSILLMPYRPEEECVLRYLDDNREEKIGVWKPAKGFDFDPFTFLPMQEKFFQCIKEK